MKLTLAEPKLLKDSIGIISELVNEASFKINKDGLELIAMDPANVAMVIFKMLSSSFVEYDVPDDVILAVNLDNFNQVLKRVKPSDTLTLEIDNEKNKLRIKLRGESSRTFNLSLIDIDKSEQKVPELKFSVQAGMPASVFSEAIDDMDIVSESVAFAAEANKFTIESEGRFNAAKVEISTDEELSLSLGEEGKVLSKYSIEYLKKIIKGSKLTNNVKLYFSKEYPLRVDYQIVDKLMLSFILAPRVDSD
jgi:proliferating cell nuclear antigen